MNKLTPVLLALIAFIGVGCVSNPPAPSAPIAVDSSGTLPPPGKKRSSSQDNFKWSSVAGASFGDLFQSKELNLRKVAVLSVKGRWGVPRQYSESSRQQVTDRLDMITTTKIRLPINNALLGVLTNQVHDEFEASLRQAGFEVVDLRPYYASAHYQSKGTNIGAGDSAFGGGWDVTSYGSNEFSAGDLTFSPGLYTDDKWLDKIAADTGAQFFVVASFRSDWNNYQQESVDGVPTTKMKARTTGVVDVLIPGQLASKRITMSPFFKTNGRFIGVAKDTITEEVGRMPLEVSSPKSRELLMAFYQNMGNTPRLLARQAIESFMNQQGR